MLLKKEITIPLEKEKSVQLRALAIWLQISFDAVCLREQNC